MPGVESSMINHRMYAINVEIQIVLPADPQTSNNPHKILLLLVYEMQRSVCLRNTLRLT